MEQDTKWFSGEPLNDYAEEAGQVFDELFSGGITNVEGDANIGAAIHYDNFSSAFIFVSNREKACGRRLPFYWRISFVINLYVFRVKWVINKSSLCLSCIGCLRKNCQLALFRYTDISTSRFTKKYGRHYHY